MDYFKAFEVSAAGMAAQKARVDAATLNLANMHASIAPGTAGYRPVTALIRSATTSFPRVMVAAELVERAVVPRSAFEPGHPHADADGMVSYPAVDPTQEMMTVMTALRSYEANLAALQASRTLAARALEIGSP
jgi:flagellar basal-body rod protein FlgC